MSEKRYTAKDMQAAWRSGYNTHAMGGRLGGEDKPGVHWQDGRWQPCDDAGCVMHRLPVGWNMLEEKPIMAYVASDCSCKGRGP